MCDLEGTASNPAVWSSDCKDWRIQLDMGTGVWTRSQKDSNDPPDTQNSLRESPYYCQGNKNCPNTTRMKLFYVWLPQMETYLECVVCICKWRQRENTEVCYIPFINNYSSCLYIKMCICLHFQATERAWQVNLPLGTETAAGFAFFCTDGSQSAALRSHSALWTVITCRCEDEGERYAYTERLNRAHKIWGLLTRCPLSLCKWKRNYVFWNSYLHCISNNGMNSTASCSHSLPLTMTIFHYHLGFPITVLLIFLWKQFLSLLFLLLLLLTYSCVQTADNLLGMVLPVCLCKEDQDDLHPLGRRSLSSIYSRELKARHHHSSNLGDMDDSPPESRERTRGRESDAIRKNSHL